MKTMPSPTSAVLSTAPRPAMKAPHGRMWRRKTGRTLLCASLAAVSSLAMLSSLNAAVLVTYNFNASTYAASGIASGLTGSAITPGTQIATSGTNFTTAYSTEGAASFVASGTSIYAGSANTETAFGVAATNGIYLEFTLTPDAGKKLNMVNLSVDVARGAGASNIDRLRFAVTSSVAGHAYANRLTISTENATDFASIPHILESAKGNAIQVAPLGLNQAWGNGDNTIIDLSGLSFQNISSATTFRLYAFSTVSDNSHDIRLDNIFLNGSVIPEPGTFALLMVGLAGVMLRRRRPASQAV